jgi:cell division septation protein DedD
VNFVSDATMATSQDTEITLGTGKLLVFFFALVVVCALFFGLGFSLGRSASTAPGSAAQASMSSGGERPPAGTTGSQKPSSDLSFYKSVEQKTPDAQLATPEATPASQNPNGSASESKTAADPMAPPALSGYLVQVAAVTKPEDAEALVNALKKKQYPAFAVNNTPSDKLYRVQVGPYPDIKDAESIRARLVSDGYNPILKK